MLFKFLHPLALAGLVFAIAATPARLGAQTSGGSAGALAGELTSVRDVRALTPEQAHQGRPVRLRGVVTVLSGWKSSFFFQDATSGISVDRADDSPRLQPGQLIELRGVTASGMFAPVVSATSVTVVGKGELPAARLAGSDKLSGGKQDSQWLAIRGIVRSALVKPSWGRPVLFLEVDIGGGALVTVRVHDFPMTGLDRLPASTVYIRGVCGTVFNDKRQFVGLRLFVANLNDIRVERLAAADPFSGPLRPFGSLLEFGVGQAAVDRIKVRGIVTYARPGQGLYIQEGAQGVFVQSWQTTPVPLGSRVEVVGYPAVGRYSPTLDEALFRIIGPAQPLSGVEQSASQMIVDNDGFPSAPYDSVLVHLKGVLLEQVPGIEEDLLLLQDGASLFTARLPRTDPARPPLAVGSLLGLTGVCLVKADNDREARVFEILLRSGADITVLKNGPWWTADHARSVVAALLVLAVVLMSGWLAILQRQAGLRLLTLTDQLTGLYNRRGFLLLAEHQWQLALRKKESLFIFYIDVDLFKEINDSLGHKQGDLALQAVAAVLRECFRKTDIIGRLGGDEFVVTAVDAHPQSGGQLERRLAETVRHSNQKPGRQFQLSLSVGVLTCDSSSGDSSIEELLTRADSLMYQRKQDSRDRLRKVAPIPAMR